MRVYNTPHAYYCGVDLHARSLYVNVLDDKGTEVPVIMGCYGIGVFSVVTIAASKEKQALHDFAAQTLVLRGRPATVGVLETWRIAIGLGLPFVLMTAIFLATL